MNHHHSFGFDTHRPIIGQLDMTYSDALMNKLAEFGRANMMGMTDAMRKYRNGDLDILEYVQDHVVPAF